MILKNDKTQPKTTGSFKNSVHDNHIIDNLKRMSIKWNDTKSQTNFNKAQPKIIYKLEQKWRF